MVLERKKYCCDMMSQLLHDKYSTVTKIRKSSSIYDLYYRNVIVLYEKKQRCITPLLFCPWCGHMMEYAFEIELEHKLARVYDENSIDIASDGVRLDKVLSGDFPECARKWVTSKDWFFKRVQNSQNEHKHKLYCDYLWYDVDHPTPLLYHKNIRSFRLIVREDQYKTDAYKNQQWELLEAIPIDYCYECGAKFPPRLDEELTRILQDEYGLESWKDYKKAPHEFHTDEWWKKRGL